MPSNLTAAGSTNAWRKLRQLVLERDGYRCQVLLDDDGMPTDGGGRPCGEQLTIHDPTLPTHATVDHIRDRADGGDDDPANLRAASRRCNGRRAAQRTNRRGVVATSRAW